MIGSPSAIITLGLGNGDFSGSTLLVLTFGYGTGELVVAESVTAPNSDFGRYKVTIYQSRTGLSSYNTDIGGVAQTTPAQIIRSFLIDVGVVTYPHRPVNGLFPCYAFSMPDNNDFAVCIIDVVGRLYGRGMRPNHNNIHPGVEILVRDRDETKGYLRMLRIAEALDFASAVTTITPEDGMEHYITNIRRTTPVITLGEEIGKRRYRWSMNACVVFEKDSEPQLG